MACMDSRGAGDAPRVVERQPQPQRQTRADAPAACKKREEKRSQAPCRALARNLVSVSEHFSQKTFSRATFALRRPPPPPPLALKNLCLARAGFMHQTRADYARPPSRRAGSNAAWLALGGAAVCRIDRAPLRTPPPPLWAWKNERRAHAGSMHQTRADYARPPSRRAGSNAAWLGGAAVSYRPLLAPKAASWEESTKCPYV